jgi:hypothetical protein
MSNYIVKQSSMRTLKPGDTGFVLNDGIILSPRAGFEINQHCPKAYKDIIAECLSNGWLQPVATVYDRELMWDRLSK